MRKLSAALALLWLVAVPAWVAITLAQARTAIDAYIDTIETNARNQIVSCLATREDCSTAWSCNPTALCNTVATDNAVCQNTQTDTGYQAAVLNDNGTCSVTPTGQGTFASRGINLPASAPVCFQLNVYSGPGGRGGNLCYRAKYAGTVYEKCRGFGPQAASFTHDWAAQ